MAQQCDIEPLNPRTCWSQTQRSNITSNSVEKYYKLGVAVPFLDHILSEFEHRYLCCELLVRFSGSPKYKLSLTYFSHEIPN